MELKIGFEAKFLLIQTNSPCLEREELDNDVIPLISNEKSLSADDSENIIPSDDLCLKLLLPFSSQIARKFYQEISFSSFNNFHIIQFYFNFPSLVKNYGEVACSQGPSFGFLFAVFAEGG